MGTEVTTMNQNKYNERDFQWAFGLNRLILDLMGIWPNEVKSEHYIFKVLRVPILVLTILVALFLPQMYALTYVFSQLQLAVDNLTISCTTLTCTIKLFLLWSNRQVLKPLIKSAMNDWISMKSPWERKIMARQALFGRIFTISGYCIIVFCLIGILATPLFGISVRIINNLTDEIDGRFFPLQTYYPYKATISPYFEITYVSQLIAASFVAISFSVPDNFFGVLVFHASAQCEILEAKMSRLLPENDKRIMQQEGGEKRFIRMKLKKLVDTHVCLIRYVGGVEDCFNVLILVQIVGLSLTICCLGFSVIKSIKTENKGLSLVQIITLIATLFNAMFHMFIYCFSGEILETNSLGFFYAIYYSNWFLLPSNISRDIIIVMVRSKSELQLTAGKFFYLSFKLYLKIIKTLFGYVSILLAVTN